MQPQACTPVALLLYGVPSRRCVVIWTLLRLYFCLTVFGNSSPSVGEMVHSRSSFGRWKHGQRCNRYRSGNNSSAPTTWNYVAFVPPAPPPPDFFGVEPLSIGVEDGTLEDSPVTRADCSFLTVQWGVRFCSTIRAKQSKESFFYWRYG